MSLLKRIEQGKQSGEEDASVGGSGSRLGTLEARRVSPPRKDAQDETYADLKVRVQNRLLAELDPSIDVSEVEKVRGMIRDLFEQILTEESIVLSRQEKHRLFEQIAAEILGFGPLQPLLEDDEITEVMVNGAKSCYFEKDGKISRAPVTFESD